MTIFDWLIVFFLNGGIIAFGIYLSRQRQTSSQWFLGSRALPWWGIGLSMFATNVDNADLVGITGNAYLEGIHNVTVYALGSAVGGIIAAFIVVPIIYRAGFYTNAEYLEARFGPATRVLSALIQIQYRSSMLGLMIWSVFLLLTDLVQIPSQTAWVLILISIVMAGYYSGWGGLRAVVWTDALQGLVMMAAGIVIFSAVWQAIGGWSGMTTSLAAIDAAEGSHLSDLSHAGKYHGDFGETSPYFVVVGWTIVASGYWTVNHTQTMRLMGARSLWDMRMAALFGVAVSMPIVISCSCIGLFAHAIPEFQHETAPDMIYPKLANRFLTVGFKGLVVAGIFSAAVSTFDSMGASLSAIFTRDIYARLLVPDREDQHYVVVSRWATTVILALGFAYLPFIWYYKNMIRAFTTLIPVFVTPLFTIYLVGAVSKASRRSGLIGLMVGSTYGVIALLDRDFWDFSIIPVWLTSRWMAFSFSFLITAVTMLVVTMLLGREQESTTESVHDSGWLSRSRETLPPIREHPFRKRVPVFLNTNLWAIALVLFSGWVVFGLFW